jgi:hypothetical protein
MDRFSATRRKLSQVGYQMSPSMVRAILLIYDHARYIQYRASGDTSVTEEIFHLPVPRLLKLEGVMYGKIIMV